MKHTSFIKAGAVGAVLALTAGGLAACSGDGGNTSGSGGATTVTMLVLGDKPTNGRLEAMLEELNAQLREEVGAELSLYYVEWADWQTQYNVKLLANDGSVDLITTATDWLFAWENAEKGAFLELDEELLKENAPKTWAQVDGDGDWDVATLNDTIYFIPEDNFTQYTNHGFFYRGDWATEAGITDGTIEQFEDFTTYFQWVKDNQPQAYPWDAAGSMYAAIDGYIAGHTDLQTIQQITAGNYFPFQTRESDQCTITSYLSEGDDLLAAAELAKEWNEIGVWREDAINFDGDTREELYAGLSGTDQHHTQTFIGQIVYNMNTKQPGSDPKMFHWGQENGNFFRDIKTHGAMAVSAASKNPELALQVYDILRNDETAYRLLNYGIEGTDYIITEDGKLGYPEGYDPSVDSLGSNFWAGRMDEFELDKTTDAPDKWEIYAELDAVAKDYPYETLVFDKNSIDSTLAAVSGVLAEYLPQLQYGKFDDPAKAIADMRSALQAAGFDDAMASLQGNLDDWAAETGFSCN